MRSSEWYTDGGLFRIGVLVPAQERDWNALMPFQTLRFGSDPQLLAASTNKPPLQKGATGEGVAILQQALVDLGFPMPNSTAHGIRLPDGIFGTETARTVLAFQKAHHLKQDGLAGAKTLQKLEQLLIANAQIENFKLVAEMQGPPNTRRIVSS